MASGMDFIGHVAAQAVVWKHCGLGPGTQALSLRRPRGQGCLERGHKRLVRELKKRFCLLDLESSARRCCSSWGWGTHGGGGSAGVGRVSSQTSRSPALSPGATFLNLCPAQTHYPKPLEYQPRHRRSPDSRDPAQTLAGASSEPQEPRLQSHHGHDPLPQIPGGSLPSPLATYVPYPGCW